MHAQHLQISVIFRIQNFMFQKECYPSINSYTLFSYTLYRTEVL